MPINNPMCFMFDGNITQLDNVPLTGPSAFGTAPPCSGSPCETSVIPVNASIFAGTTPLSVTLYGSPAVEALNVYVTNPITAVVSGDICVTQCTSPWVVSGTVTADQGGTWNIGTVTSITNPVAVTQSGSWTVGVSGTVAATQSGTWTVQQGSAPWSVTFPSAQHVIVDSATLGTVTVTGTVAVSGTVAVTQSGTWTVQQGGAPWTFVGNLTNNNAAPAATNIGALIAVANAAPPSWTEGDQVLESVDLSGHQRVVGPVSTTASSPAQTSVTSTSSSILASNSLRLECTIVNTGTVQVYLGLNGKTPTATAYHIALSPCTTANDGTGGTYTTDIMKGQINAIVASTSGTVCVTELTA
jgi:hypothetical protein